MALRGHKHMKEVKRKGHIERKVRENIEKTSKSKSGNESLPSCLAMA